MVKRFFDIIFSLLALALFSPLLLAASIWIKADSSGPVFFRQIRVTRYGRHFRIYKLRTMHTNAESRGLQITTGDDYRITKAGFFLRRYKIDELPQFINVLTGDMSVVGPRPEVPKYVAHYPAEMRDIILSIRPGITDRASIEFKDENSLLDASKNPEQTYIQEILPIKLKYYIEYSQHQTLIGDLKIILDTVAAVVR